METKIHFKNEPFMAVIQGKGEEPILCTPAIYDQPFNFGLGVFYEDGTGQVWGLVCPRNMIAAWRGTEVLRLLKKIEHGTLCSAYYTGIRDPHAYDVKSYVEPTIKEIGQSEYDRILSMKIPEEIIRAILDNQKDENSKPDIYPITDEVRAGTIEWRQEFADAGVENPKTVDEKALEQKQTIHKFEKLLQLYAKSMSLSRNCLGMNYVEDALLTLVEKGADKKHPTRLVIAAAGVVGGLATMEAAAMMFPPSSRLQLDEYNDTLERKKQNSIEVLAQQLADNWGRPTFSFSKEHGHYSLEQARSILNELVNKYFPLKQTA